MKITQIDVHRVEQSLWGVFWDIQRTAPCSSPMSPYPEYEGSLESWIWPPAVVLVRIETDTGHSGIGWAEDGAGAASSIIRMHLARFLIKLFGRFSRVRTDLESDNYANSPAVQNDNGGIMNNRNIAGDAVYLLNAYTVLNFRMSYASLEDDYNGHDRKIGEKGLAEFWPNNPWYKPYIG